MLVHEIPFTRLGPPQTCPSRVAIMITVTFPPHLQESARDHETQAVQTSG